MRKLLHHYQKHLVTDPVTDRIEWDMYRLTDNDTISYELCGTLTYVANPDFCPTPENLAEVFHVPMEGYTDLITTIKSYDKLTRTLVIGGMLTFTDIDSANQRFAEIIQRLVYKP